MNIKLTKFKRITALFFLILISVIFGLIIWISSPVGERFVKVQLEQKLSDILNQTVIIGSLETNFFSRIVINDIKVFHESKSPDTILLSGRYAHVNYQLYRLLRAQVAIDDIVLSEFRVEVVHDSAGQNNIPTIGENNAGDRDGFSALTIQIGSVEMSDLTVRYSNKTVPFEGIMNGVDVNINTTEAGNYDLSFHADSLISNYKEKHLDIGTIDIEGELQNDTLTITQILTENGGFNLTGSAAANLSDLLNTGTGTFIIETDMDGLRQVAEELLPEKLAKTNGDLSISLTLLSNQAGIEYSGVFSSKNLNFSEISISNADIPFKYAQDEVILDSFVVVFSDGSVEGSGQIDINEKYGFKLTLESKGIYFGPILNSIVNKHIELDGKISGDVQLSGNLTEFNNTSIQAKLHGTEMKYRNENLPDVDWDIIYKNKHIQSTAHFNNNTLTADGSITPEGFDVDAKGDFSSFNTLSLLLKRDFVGKGHIRCQIEGPFRNPALSFEVDATNLAYNDFPIDTLSSEFSYDQSGFTFHNARLRAADIPAESLLKTFAIDGFSGTATYDAHVSGQNDFSGDVTVTLEKPAYKQLIFNDGLFKVAFTGEDMIFNSISLNSDSLRVNGEGEYDFTLARGHIQLDLESVIVDTTIKDVSSAADNRMWQKGGSLAARIDRSDSLSPAFLIEGDSLDIHAIAGMFTEISPDKGIMGFTIDFNGDFEKPEGKLNISVDKASYNDVLIDTLTAAIYVKPDSLWMQSMKIISNKGELSGQAGISLNTGNSRFSGKNRIEGNVSVRSIDMTALKAFLPQRKILTGNGSIDVSWMGRLDEPIFNGSVHIADGAYGDDSDINSFQNINIDMILKENKLIIDSAGAKTRDVPIRVDGEMSINRMLEAIVDVNGYIGDGKSAHMTGSISPDSLDLVLETNNFNLSSVQPFLTFLIGLDGNVNSKININGEIASPVVGGTVSMRDVSFKTAYFNRPVTNGTIDLNIANRKVTIDSLRFKSNDGNIKADGFFVYTNATFEDIDISAAIKEMKIDQPDKYSFIMNSGDITYRKTDNARLNLAGTVVFDEGEINYNLRPQEFLRDKSSSGNTKQKKPLPIMADTNLNIRVSNTNPLLINNNVAYVTFNSEIELIGTLEKPNLNGRISTQDGYILYLDRQFEIANGVFDFINPDQINPIVDFQAVTNIQEIQTFAGETYAITLNVNGELDNAAIVMNSSPPLSKPDIMALLTFGSTAEQLSGAQLSGTDASAGAIMMERVSELSGRMASNYLSRKASSLLGIKGFSVRGNLFGSQNNSQNTELKPEQIIEKQLKTDYTPNVGESNNRGIRLRYDISRLFSVEGYTNQTGQSGLDLEYSLTFE